MQISFIRFLPDRQKAHSLERAIMDCGGQVLQVQEIDGIFRVSANVNSSCIHALDAEMEQLLADES